MDENTNLNIYSLSRYFWDFAFENPVKIKPIHCSIYFFAVEHCNRLGWKKNFGLPTSMVIEAIGVKSYSVYKSAFDDLISFGFFEIIQYSKNQYSSNVIALKENDKANNKANSKALDKALIKHVTKQCESTVQSIDSIIIQLTRDKEQLTNKQLIALRKICENNNVFDFKSELIKIGVEESVVKDWLSVRSKKKGSNTETAFNAIKKQIELSGLSANECVETAVIKNWVGFEASWLKQKPQQDTTEKKPTDLCMVSVLNEQTGSWNSERLTIRAYEMNLRMYPNGTKFIKYIDNE